MKNCLKKHLTRKNNTLVKNSFMVSKSCVIEKRAKSFITQHLFVFHLHANRKISCVGLRITLALAMTYSASHEIKKSNKKAPEWVLNY